MGFREPIGGLTQTPWREGQTRNAEADKNEDDNNATEIPFAAPSSGALGGLRR